MRIRERFVRQGKWGDRTETRKVEEPMSMSGCTHIRLHRYQECAACRIAKRPERKPPKPRKTLRRSCAFCRRRVFYAKVAVIDGAWACPDGHGCARRAEAA